MRHAHLSVRPRDRSRIRCESAGPHGIVLEQPSDRGGRLLTFVDFSGSATRVIAGVVRDGKTWQVLHATTPEPPVVLATQGAGASLIIDAGREPFGIVLHLPEAHDED